jgi:hypothetical protein
VRARSADTSYSETAADTKVSICTSSGLLDHRPASVQIVISLLLADNDMSRDYHHGVLLAVRNDNYG